MDVAARQKPSDSAAGRDAGSLDTRLIAICESVACGESRLWPIALRLRPDRAWLAGLPEMRAPGGSPDTPTRAGFMAVLPQSSRRAGSGDDV